MKFDVLLILFASCFSFFFCACLFFIHLYIYFFNVSESFALEMLEFAKASPLYRMRCIRSFRNLHLEHYQMNPPLT
jgi:hypothetical protein